VYTGIVALRGKDLFMAQKCEFENMWAETHGTYRKM
jgi:hypothetical protein